MTPAQAEKSLNSAARHLFIVSEQRDSLEERVATLEQRVQSLVEERLVVEELRREDAERIRELEERLCLAQFWGLST